MSPDRRLDPSQGLRRISRRNLLQAVLGMPLLPNNGVGSKSEQEAGTPTRSVAEPKMTLIAEINPGLINHSDHAPGSLRPVIIPQLSGLSSFASFAVRIHAEARGSEYKSMPYAGLISYQRGCIEMHLLASKGTWYLAYWRKGADLITKIQTPFSGDVFNATLEVNDGNQLKFHSPNVISYEQIELTGIDFRQDSTPGVLSVSVNPGSWMQVHSLKFYSRKTSEA